MEPQDTNLPVLASDVTIGPFKAVVNHTHAGNIGPDPTPNSHDVSVRLTFRADNAEGITFVLNQNTQTILGDILGRFFNRDFTNMPFETIAQSLFRKVVTSMPRLRDEFNERAFHLHAVHLKVTYDGTLDHPTQTAEYSASVITP